MIIPSAQTHLSCVCIGLLATLASAAAWAQPVAPPQAGSWTITTSADRYASIKGVAKPAVHSRKTQTICLSPDQANVLALGRVDKPDKAGRCGQFSVKRDGPRLVANLHCEGAMKLDIRSTYQFDTAQHYSGTIETMTWSATLATDNKRIFDARRIGECGK